MLACEGFIRTCRWNVQGHCQWSPLYVLILSWHSLGLLLLACSFKHWPVSSDEPAKPQEDHGQCLTVHIWMKHKWLSKTVYESFILERAFEYGAGWWYTGETAFCYPWCCLDHHPQRPPPSSALRHQHVGKYPAIPNGVGHEERGEVKCYRDLQELWPLREGCSGE